MKEKRDIMSRARVLLRGLGLGLLALVFVTPYALTLPLDNRIRRPFAKGWYYGTCRMLGLDITTIGRPYIGAPVLFTSNHVSYLDILVLGAQADMTFVAKHEIADWPLIGFLAKLARTEFISREAALARAQFQVLTERLAGGENLMLFPEGTSTNGETVLPFKSSLFAVAYAAREVQETMVQPVTVAYTRLKGGAALYGDLRDIYAFHGKMSLRAHLKSVMERPGVEVEVRFHEPVSPAAFASRKHLAMHCQSAVATGLALSNQG